ncbi:MAG: S-methyl-5-thioribose-1-phosphate isomerase [Candidatus Latescibacteria bacterium]|nr:S-methyl-5-thioribose-1-phosphate isomerase [bacterium]MBD3424422.1 S-methyl-5-thioribose-1-phosphate isomerase [Candidatus Latescibacterota bacterium]
METIDYRKGKVRIIDQTLLPGEYRILELDSVEQVAEAIRSLRVRGAPAIGIAAAYGMLLSLDIILREKSGIDRQYFFDREEEVMTDIRGIEEKQILGALARAGELLRKTRPTAVNLSWAVESMNDAVRKTERDPALLVQSAARKAFEIHREELSCEYNIGRFGSGYIRSGMRILTHCNAGGLATAGYGTALAVIYQAHSEGKDLTVYADETRPLLQGTRLTAWELDREGVDVRVLCDGAAASLIASSSVDCVVVGADRIAANGDTANKIGTLGLAVLCSEFGLPFYVAAPLSTFDLSLESGDGIEIENRSGEEVSVIAGRRMAPPGVRVYNPAFDVTPASYINSIITEKGVITNPDAEKIRSFFDDHSGR